jgi:hypothetical protein
VIPLNMIIEIVRAEKLMVETEDIELTS